MNIIIHIKIIEWTNKNKRSVLICLYSLGVWVGETSKNSKEKNISTSENWKDFMVYCRQGTCTK